MAQAALAPAASPPKRFFLVEGQRLTEETHGVYGLPGYYARLVARCFRHKDGRCVRTRVFGCKAGLASKLDDLETLAFWGAWLSAGSAYSDSAGHQAFSPNTEAVVSYATAQAWRPASAPCSSNAPPPTVLADFEVR